jgi:hypothetical protein
MLDVTYNELKLSSRPKHLWDLTVLISYPTIHGFTSAVVVTVLPLEIYTPVSNTLNNEYEKYQ